MVMLIKLLITNYHSKCEHIELYTYIRPAERGDRGRQISPGPQALGASIGIFLWGPSHFFGRNISVEKIGGGEIFQEKLSNRGQRKKFAPGPRKALCGPGCSIQTSS